MNDWPRFPGDDRRELVVVQFESYSQASRLIVEAARSAVIGFKRKSRFDAFFLNDVMALSTYDHRTVQNSHDVIAASYRWMVRCVALPNTWSAADRARIWRSSWLQYCEIESEVIFRSIDRATDVLEAVIFANQEWGLQAEARLRAYLSGRYHFASDPPREVAGAP